MVEDLTVATLALTMVSASFPFYLYGAWIMIDTEVVTWDTLVYHLKFIVVGLSLNTLPVALWMGPRLINEQQFGGLAALHSFLGLQAYALLLFALTGIYHILQAKRRLNLYEDPDQDIALDEIHENMPAWRFRLRVGVFGYVGFWILAYVVGIMRYVVLYQIL
ncbi:hypothetical protein [Haloarchaeobius sp. FL176]|uniref:DUF7321 family protein n=1 Tax=Haloarchaeobius sp. FL176 TaxID=2967129 RepID=UPI0021476B17|nr:hypothetical protein [Haloarchaeobius sp. FL176]